MVKASPNPSTPEVQAALSKKKLTGSKKKPKDVTSSEASGPLYPHLEVRIFVSDFSRLRRAGGEPNPLTADIAKEILGWEELADDDKRPHLLVDKYGKRIRCENNLANRSYYPQLAGDWMLEVLRKKWRLNGEPIIVDKEGNIHDGQHRLIGLILAVQEWEKDREKEEQERKWAGFWGEEEPAIDAMVVLGIDGSDDTVNTIGTGKPRTLTDVLYRCSWFANKKANERTALAKVTSWAVKLLWTRTAQQLNSFAPRRPHSESLEFIANHERILECVRFIYEEAGDNDKLAHFLPLGYAAALLYLMGSAASDSDVYDRILNESALDWKLWDLAQDFWTDLVNNGKKTEAVREALLRIPEGIGGGYERDLRCGILVKAWNLYSDGQELSVDALELETKENDAGQPVLVEFPTVGGIDVGRGVARAS